MSIMFELSTWMYATFGDGSVASSGSKVSGQPLSVLGWLVFVLRWVLIFCSAW